MTIKLKKNNICEKAKRYWTIRKKFEDAGNCYILKDGRVLDLHYNGKNYDHAEVGLAWSTIPVEEYWRQMDADENNRKFQMKCAAIRATRTPSSLYVESEHRPTEKQAQVLVHDIQRVTPKFIILKRGDACEFVSRNPRPLDVQRWISKCW